MRRRKRKTESNFSWMKYVVIMCIVAISTILFAIYALPFIAYYQVESAIMTKDTGKLASYTDFNELKRNMKNQKGQRVIKNLKKDDGTDQSLVDLSIAWSAITTDVEIDRSISTEGFYVNLSGMGLDNRKPDRIKPMQEVNTIELVKKLFDDASFNYQSFSKFTVNVKDKKGRYVEYFLFTFDRDGLTWKLTNVRLPMF
ncbi:MAG: hypothetical protein CSYNP_01152 [Syntrophus sp. SKADARSKE-3]|nr:hypothetical protein [Syntrophus sp. SKADARSKE-3]